MECYNSNSIPLLCVHVNLLNTLCEHDTLIKGSHNMILLQQKACFSVLVSKYVYKTSYVMIKRILTKYIILT